MRKVIMAKLPAYFGIIKVGEINRSQNIQEKCKICLKGNLKVNETIQCISCDSSFHIEHIAAWIANDSYCPNCYENFPRKIIELLNPFVNSYGIHDQLIISTKQRIQEFVPENKRSMVIYCYNCHYRGFPIKSRYSQRKDNFMKFFLSLMVGVFTGGGGGRRSKNKMRCPECTSDDFRELRPSDRSRVLNP